MSVAICDKNPKAWVHVLVNCQRRLHYAVLSDVSLRVIRKNPCRLVRRAYGSDAALSGAALKVATKARREFAATPHTSVEQNSCRQKMPAGRESSKCEDQFIAQEMSLGVRSAPYNSRVPSKTVTAARKTEPMSRRRSEARTNVRRQGRQVISKVSYDPEISLARTRFPAALEMTERKLAAMTARFWNSSVIFRPLFFGFWWKGGSAICDAAAEMTAAPVEFVRIFKNRFKAQGVWRLWRCGCQYFLHVVKTVMGECEVFLGLPGLSHSTIILIKKLRNSPISDCPSHEGGITEYSIWIPRFREDDAMMGHAPNSCSNSGIPITPDAKAPQAVQDGPALVRSSTSWSKAGSSSSSR